MINPEQDQLFVFVSEHATLEVQSAAVFAQELVAKVRQDLIIEPEPTGFAAEDRSRTQLFCLDKERQAEFGDKYVYFGHSYNPYNYLYQALLAGYNPTEDQIRKSEEERNDFLWDEILELHREHRDIFEQLHSYGYEKTHMSGSYAIPEDALASMFRKLYRRGQEYRSCGFGFPYWSDYIEPEAIE